MLLVVIVLAVLLLALCAIFLLFADGDLTLMCTERFGHKAEILKGQVAWVTGASSGIGKHVAYELARVGCKLVLSARNTDELEKVRKECLSRGCLKDSDVLVLPFDITDITSHHAATDTVINTFGQIDVLVNNVGRSQRAFVVETDLAVDREMIELNVVAPISLTKCVLPHMITRRQGRIVVTSSISSKIAVPHSATYCLTKSAINAWFHTLSVEMTPHNISVTVVCPGPVFSNLSSSAFTGKSGQVYGGDQVGDMNRMSASRCAELMVIATANRLYEVWIAYHPVLAFTYCMQFLPSLSFRILHRVGLKKIAAVREGRWYSSHVALS